ncbi:MAG: hypothetical protein ACYDEX_07020 [Mobilitalea sp.]
MDLSNKKPMVVENKISNEEYIAYSEFRKTLVNASRKEDAPVITDDEKIIFKILEENMKAAAKSKELSYSIGYWDLVYRQVLNNNRYHINISKKEFELFMNKFASEKGLDIKVYNDRKFICAEEENVKNLGATFKW